MCKREIEKVLKIIILLLLPLLLTPSGTFGAEADRGAKAKAVGKADFTLTVKDDLISLKATDASLKEVLEEIGQRMKIDVVANIPDEKITAEFDQLSLEEALRRLGTNYSYVMDSTKGEKKITKIIVLAKGKETALPSTAKEAAIKKEERSVRPESKVREEAIKKESPPPEPFKFQFDPSQYGEKRK